MNTLPGIIAMDARTKSSIVTDARSSLNLQTLILRFTYVFFSISVPLLGEQRQQVISALPLIGGSGLACSVLLLTSHRAARILDYLYAPMNVLCGGLFIALFAGIPIPQPPLLFQAFGIVLGVSSASTELICLRRATERHTHMRQRMSVFNALRVLGIAMGLFLGCSIAGQTVLASVSRWFVVLAGAMLGFLAAHDLATARRGAPPDQLAAHDQEVQVDPARIRRGCVGIAFIVMDLVSFTVLLSYVPVSLNETSPWGKVLIGLCMASQAVTHAFGQFLWRSIITRIGESPAFWLSLIGNVFMICLITQVHISPFLLVWSLFVLTGFINSGTYLSSTAWFYTARFPTSGPTQVAVHNIASNIGKWLGAMLVNWLVVRL